MGTGNHIIATRHPSLVDLFGEEGIEFIAMQSEEAIVAALKGFNGGYTEIRLKNHRFITENCSVSRFTDSVLNVIFAGS